MSTVKTLFIRCPAITSRYELVNGFLQSVKEELGIAGWYTGNEKEKGEEQEGRSFLHFNAPVEVFYAASSRKPYFLLEFRFPTADELRSRGGRKQRKRNSESPPRVGESSSTEEGSSSTAMPSRSTVKPTEEEDEEKKNEKGNKDPFARSGTSLGRALAPATPSSSALKATENNSEGEVPFFFFPPPSNKAEDFLDDCAGKLILCHSREYHGRVVEIALAAPGITVESQREKRRLRDRLERQDSHPGHSTNNTPKHNKALLNSGFHQEKEGKSRKPTSKVTPTSFIPRVVQKRRTA